MSTSERIPPIAFISAITGCILWGSALSIVKIALEEYDPVFLVFARMAISALVLTPIVLLRFRPVRIYSKRDFLLLLLLTLCDPVGFFTFEALALQYTSASQASMMWAMAPLLNTMAALLILRERTSRPVVICFVVAMAGVMVLTAGSGVSEHAGNPFLGNFLEFLSLCGAAGFLVILRFLRGRYPAMLVVWFQSLGAAILFLPTLAFDSVALPAAFHLGPFLALVYLGACVTFGAQACSAFAVARMPVSRLSAISNIIPVVGVLTGMLLLGETMSPIQWAASAAVLGIVLVSQHYQKKDSGGDDGGRTENIVDEAIRKEEAGKPLLSSADV